jgi:hypothetical protein
MTRGWILVLGMPGTQSNSIWRFCTFPRASRIAGFYSPSIFPF